jgi:hypothetical protein
MPCPYNLFPLCPQRLSGEDFVFGFPFLIRGN